MFLRNTDANIPYYYPLRGGSLKSHIFFNPSQCRSSKYITSSLTIDKLCSSETLTPIYRTTRCKNTEYNTINIKTSIWWVVLRLIVSSGVIYRPTGGKHTGRSIFYKSALPVYIYCNIPAKLVSSLTIPQGDWELSAFRTCSSHAGGAEDTGDAVTALTERLLLRHSSKTE